MFRTFLRLYGFVSHFNDVLMYRFLNLCPCQPISLDYCLMDVSLFSDSSPFSLIQDTFNGDLVLVL